MGAIQNATNQLVQTGLGAALAVKHFSEQQKLRELQATEFGVQNLREQKEYAQNVDQANEEIAGLEQGKFEIEADADNNRRDMEAIGATVKKNAKGQMSLSYRHKESGQFISRKEVQALEEEQRNLTNAYTSVNSQIELKKAQKSLFQERLEQSRSVGKAGAKRFGYEYREVKTLEEQESGGNK